MRFKPPMILRKRTVRPLLAAGSVLAAVSGLAFAQSVPAKADPTFTLVAVGADTAQDVWNAFSTQALAPSLVASYNATNPATGAINEIITPTDGWAAQNNIVPDPTDAHPLAAGDCSFARPNGSGQGVAALRIADNVGVMPAGAVAPYPSPGCVDIAPASFTVDVTDDNPSQDIQWVPFAVDAVTGATGPSSCTPSTNCPSFTADLGNGSTKDVTTVASTLGAGVGAFTLADIQSLYSCGTATVTVGGTTTTYWPTGSTTAQPAGSQAIDLYVPQFGSGTRLFWESPGGVGFPSTEVDSTCVHSHIINGALAPANDGGVSVLVQDDDGTAVSTDPIGYVPFSVAQYISQSVNHHNPRFHGAVLQDINGDSPYSTAGTPSSGLNTSFPILRDVYNVVRLSRLTASGDPIGTLIDGVGSTICHQRSLIQSYGFALMSASVFNGLTCGEVTASLEGMP